LIHSIWGSGLLQLNMKSSNYVYLIECGEMFYKIGIATSVRKRLSGIKTGNPFPISLITKSKIKNAHEIEQTIHKKLKKRKVTGEWFKLSPAEVIEICVLLHSKKRREKLINGKNILDFGDVRLRDSQHKLWRIEREELYSEKAEPVEIVKVKNSEKTMETLRVTSAYISDEVLTIKAEELIKKHGNASTSFLQRMLRIGYVRAASIMDKLEEKGVVTQQKGNMRTREVIRETVELPQEYKK